MRKYIRRIQNESSMEINLNLRGEILECSLHIEKEINNLTLFLLGIYSDNNKTRVFGNRQGITFKNKIDLLYDLQVLSKEENFDFELLMIFRNKFLHDIDCSSFRSVFEQVDGIKNKFKKFIEEGENIDDEKDCLSAFKRLFSRNLKTLSEKIETKRRKMESKAELLHVFSDMNIFQIDLFFDFISGIYLSFENLDLFDNKIREVVHSITVLCQKYVDKYSHDEEFLSLKTKQMKFLQNIEMQKEYWNIVKSDSFDKKLLELNEKINSSSV